MKRKPDLSYRPEADSLPARVLQLCHRNPEDDYTTGDLATKFSVTPVSVYPQLQAALGLGLLKYAKVDDGVAKTWSAGPHLADWINGQAPASATAAGKAPPHGATAPRSHKPLDVAGVEIKRGVEIPPAVRGLGQSPYAALWERMQPGDMVELPDSRAHSFFKWASKNKHTVTQRRIAVGVKGIWRN